MLELKETLEQQLLYTLDFLLVPHSDETVGIIGQSDCRRCIA